MGTEAWRRDLVRERPIGETRRHDARRRTAAGFVDLFDHVPGCPAVPVAAVLESVLEVAGFRYASLAWLRRLTLASGRPKDLIDDLENLRPG